MNLTFGFIAFFISIIIPGILFRRFFYYGEFSKQFDSKDPVLHSIFYSIVPGVCIQVLCFVLANSLLAFNTTNAVIFNVFRDFIYGSEKSISNATTSFLNNHLDIFIYYSLTVFTISIVVGHISARLIRGFNLDKKYKILKFKNQWFYIFSGELLEFEKFEFGRSLTADSSIPYNHKISTTYADILIDNIDGMRELYTGYVVDYDLCSDDISKLERVYLLDAYRYKKKENIEETEKEKKRRKKERKNLEKKLTPEELHLHNIEYKSRIRKKIPSDVFVISGKNISNINLTYIPSEIKDELHKESNRKVYSIVSKILFTLTLLILLVHLVYRWIGLNDTFFETYSKETNFIGQTLVIMTLLQTIQLIVPTFYKDNSWNYRIKDVVLRLGALIILYVILIIFQKIGWLSDIVPLWNPF